MSAKISWKANPTSDDILSYHIERSIVGVETSNSAPFNISIGQTIQLRVDGGNLLTIALNAITNGAATANQIVTILNTALSAHGGSAKTSSGGDKVIIQSNRQTDRGSLNVKGGTALSGLGILAGIRKLQSDAVEVANIASPGEEFTDEDGEDGYQYRISAENSDNAVGDSTAWFQPFKEVVPTSIIYGYLISPDGKPMIETRVEFGPPINKTPSDDSLQGTFPNASAHVGIGVEFRETFTDENGYFQIIVPASAPVRLKIDSISLDANYKTPGADSKENFTQLNLAFNYQSMALESSYWNNF